MNISDKKLREIIQQELKDVKHSCIQVDKINYQDGQIKEIHKVVTGNGTPKEGMVYQLGIIDERQQTVLKTLEDIANRRKATPQTILNWVTLAIGFAMMFIALRGLNVGQKEIKAGQETIQATQGDIQAETKVTNDLLAPDSTEATVTIRGNVYIPILKTDSANIIHKEKVNEIYDKYLKSKKN